MLALMQSIRKKLTVVSVNALFILCPYKVSRACLFGVKESYFMVVLLCLTKKLYICKLKKNAYECYKF